MVTAGDIHHEVERKFLVLGDAWRTGAAGSAVRQGYLSIRPEATVRVRVVSQSAWLTIKGRSHGPRRVELEYPIPLREAEYLLAKLCEQPPIEKTRYVVRHAGRQWEVDEFHGANAGLIVAEIELEDPDQPIDLPPWVGEEVTDDPRYANASLVRAPFCDWGK